MTNEQLFRIVIDTNKVYIKALEDGADKDTQETLLRNLADGQLYIHHVDDLKEVQE